MNSKKAERITGLVVRQLRGGPVYVYSAFSDESSFDPIVSASGKVPGKVLHDLVEKNYERVRQIVFDRDGWRCLECGSLRGLTAHHKEYRAQGRDDRPQNLETKCFSCHRRHHQKAHRQVLLPLPSQIPARD